MSILPLLGTITGYRTSRNDKRAVVVIVIEREHTVAYIIGKEGIHCPALVRHGFSSIAQAAAKEFGLTEAAAISDRLHQADEDLYCAPLNLFVPSVAISSRSLILMK